MLDILANKKEILCSRKTLIHFRDAARDAYDKAKEVDKPELAGIAIKITYFLEAVDKKGLSGLLQDRDILLNGSIQIPSFLSAMERESFQYLYKAGAQEHMAVAERAAYHFGNSDGKTKRQKCDMEAFQTDREGSIFYVSYYKKWTETVEILTGKDYTVG